MKLQTGNRAIQIGALIGLVVSLILGLVELLGLGTGLGYELVSVVVLFLLSVVLGLEVFREGRNQGFIDRDFTFSEIISGVFAIAGIVSAILGIIGIATGTTLFALPTLFKGVLYVMLAIFLAVEMVTE